jgi:hypothetical protein
MTAKIDVEDFIGQQKLALVGVSRGGKKFSNATMKELRQKGYTVYPVNQAGGEVEGERIYASLKELPEPVGGVLIMVRPEHAEAAVREASAAGIQRVWLQQGADSPAALKAAKELGLRMVCGECILMFAGASSFHGFHRWINKVVGKLPK